MSTLLEGNTQAPSTMNYKNLNYEIETQPPRAWGYGSTHSGVWGGVRR